MPDAGARLVGVNRRSQVLRVLPSGSRDPANGSNSILRAGSSFLMGLGVGHGPLSDQSDLMLGDQLGIGKGLPDRIGRGFLVGALVKAPGRKSALTNPASVFVNRKSVSLLSRRDRAECRAVPEFRCRFRREPARISGIQQRRQGDREDSAAKNTSRKAMERRVLLQCLLLTAWIRCGLGLIFLVFHGCVGTILDSD